MPWINNPNLEENAAVGVNIGPRVLGLALLGEDLGRNLINADVNVHEEERDAVPIGAPRKDR